MLKSVKTFNHPGRGGKKALKRVIFREEVDLFWNLDRKTS